MKHVLVCIALISASTTYCHEIEQLGTEIRGMTEKRISCEEQVKQLHTQIAELNESIARAQSALETKKAEIQQKAIPAQVVSSPSPIAVQSAAA